MLHVLTALSALLVSTCGGGDWHANAALGKAILKMAKQQQVAASLVDGNGPSDTESPDNQRAVIALGFPSAQDVTMDATTEGGLGLVRGASQHAHARSGYPPVLSLV